MKTEMGFLDKMWDETLAGPAPEKGLGRLRKHKSLSAVRSPTTPIPIPRSIDRHRDDLDQTAGISRSITLLRAKSLSVETGSGASSPSSTSTSSGPSSPFSPGEMGKDPKVRRFARRFPTDHAEETSPSVYDWYSLPSSFFFHFMLFGACINLQVQCPYISYSNSNSNSNSNSTSLEPMQTYYA